MSSNSIGSYHGLAGITVGGSAEALNVTADAFQKRWWSFMGVSVFIGAGLLILNITGHRRVMKLVSQAAHNRHEAPPPQTSPEALEHALQAVTTDAQQPPAPPQAPPPS
jgi:hypothetical protein